MTRWSVCFLYLLLLCSSYCVGAHWMVSSVMKRFSPSSSHTSTSSSSLNDPVQDLNDKINLLQSEIERLKFQLIRSKSEITDLRRSKIELQQRHQEEIVAMRSQYAARVESMTVDYDERIQLVKIRLLEEMKIQYESEKSVLVKELSSKYHEEATKLKNEINQLKSSLQSNEEDVKILKEELKTERKKVSENLHSHQLQEEAQAKLIAELKAEVKGLKQAPPKQVPPPQPSSSSSTSPPARRSSSSSSSTRVRPTGNTSSTAAAKKKNASYVPNRSPSK